MSPQFTSLVDKLKEIFQIDKPELDFGIYRILRARRTQIEDFLNKRLAAKVQATLSSNAAAEIMALKANLAKSIEQAKNLGAPDPENLPKILEIKEKLAACAASLQAENEVYSHLLTFFSRYYDKGDFISQRRYKGDTYAIPYSGEEVKLHWANADQYYVKSGESFSNYDFTLPDGGKVHFRLVSAELAKDNIKDNEAVRCFVLWDPAEAEGEEPGTYPPSCIEEKDYELYIYFQYRRFKKGKNLQAKVSDDTVAQLKNLLDGRWDILQRYNIWAPAPTEKDKERTIFRKYLDAYTAKNTSDYFIHKDLQGFLSRELDFYIKNEMMHLDDIQNASAFSQIEKNLRMIQAVRAIATELIIFMAQIENFQKKLWLKKKFVVQCDYCLTMDLVPQELHAEVLANPKQQEEWRNLNTTEASLITDARMVDTRFFDETFKAKLLSSIENLDERCDGLLIHSENFGALSLIKPRYERTVDAIYVDPPYNTGNDNDFLYKDNYQHSSWLTCMGDRFQVAYHTMKESAGIWISTDDGEYAVLKNLLSDIYGSQNFVADVIWNSRKSVSNDALLSTAINHTTFFAKNKEYLDANKTTFRLKEEGEGFGNPDNDIRGPWKLDPLDAPGIRANLSYAIINPTNGEVFYPPAGRHWRFEEHQTLQYLSEGRILFGKTGKGKPGFKRFLSEAMSKGKVATTLWDDVKTTTEATKMLLDLFGDTIPKTFIDSIKPKPVELVERVVTLCSNCCGVTVDFFAGSGTTGHAVINKNREDEGARKYVLIEMGDHYHDILLPRIKKVIYSSDWKKGSPVSSDIGISQCFKYMSLESYEDTLNNIELQEAKGGDMYDTMMQEQYLLKYMLDIESRGSIINTDSFRKPFDYRLKIAVDSSGASENRKVDLVETFNYLLGLQVVSQNRNINKGYVTVEGYLRNGKRVLIFWRDCDKINSEELNAMLARRDINPKGTEFAYIYVNGDHRIANLMINSELGVPEQKVRSIEEEFLTRMFEGE